MGHTEPNRGGRPRRRAELRVAGWRIDAEVYDALRRYADREGRAANRIVEDVLRRFLRRKGEM